MTQFSHYLLFLYKLLPNHPWFRMQWHHLDRKHLLCFNLPLLSPPLPKQLNNISWLWCNSKQTVEVVTEMVAVFSKQWSWQSSRKCLQYIIWRRYKITNFKYHDGELRAPKNLSIDHHSPTLQSNCKKKKKPQVMQEAKEEPYQSKRTTVYLYQTTCWLYILVVLILGSWFKEGPWKIIAMKHVSDEGQNERVSIGQDLSQRKTLTRWSGPRKSKVRWSLNLCQSKPRL